jgi:outer membrane protein assembly factor BamB
MMRITQVLVDSCLNVCAHQILQNTYADFIASVDPIPFVGRSPDYSGPRTMCEGCGYLLRQVHGVDEYFDGSPVIGGDGTVYVTSYPRVYAFNSATGAVKWVYKFPGYFSDLTDPVLPLDGSLVVAVSTMGAINLPSVCSVHSFSAASGAKRWSWMMDNVDYLAGQLTMSPTTKTVYFAGISQFLNYTATPVTNDGALYALNTATGPSRPR